MTEPLTPEEYQHWKDTALLEGDTIDRFAATIDRLRAVNAKLEEALGRLVLLAGCSHFSGQAPRCDYCKAREAIEEARK